MLMMFLLLVTVIAQFFVVFFFFNDTATTEIYTLSLHDALPISLRISIRQPPGASPHPPALFALGRERPPRLDTSRAGLSGSTVITSLTCRRASKDPPTNSTPVTN